MSEKKRWICLYVENEIGVLARISGLFSGKSYNLNSLTVGETEDTTVSRMTISFTSDDRTFEQVKKQLNRSVEVIKVVDYTDIPIHNKEILFIRMKYSVLQMHLTSRSRTMTERIFWWNVYRQKIRTMMRSSYSSRVFQIGSRLSVEEALQ